VLSRITVTMSLLHLVHRNIVIKFTDAANTKFNPASSYVFRLIGVDAMGFLQIQDLAASDSQAGPEPTSAAYWINKDLVREIHEFELAKSKETLTYTGVAIKPPVETPVKTRVPAKRTALKQKPALS
jgi:hypothetical protein